MKKYTVEAKLVYPSAYNTGYEIDVVAPNKAEAVKEARRKVQNMGHTRQDGALKYRAVEMQ